MEESKIEAAKMSDLRVRAVNAIREVEEKMENPNLTFEYREDGVRHIAEFLERTCFRIGLTAAMVAKVKGGCAVMISAGSDSKEYNAAKIVELDGSPLESSWV